MTLQNYRPGKDGTLEPAPPSSGDWRRDLRSRRWEAAELKNPEADKTNPWFAVAFIVVLAAATFAVIVAGYSSGFWG